MSTTYHNLRHVSVDEITELELRVIALLADGLQSKEIATRIGRRRATIEGYIRVLFIKFNVRSRPQLVAAAFLGGLLPTNPIAGEVATAPG